MRCSLRIRWRVRVLTLSRCAASRVVSNLSGDAALLSPETARTCAAISAICSVNDRNTELSIVITFIFSPFFLFIFMNIGCASAYRSSKLDALHSACSMFLRQNSAINEGGFNNSLRDSRKIFPEDGSVTRSNGATGSLSAENGTCSEPYRYLCGQTDNCMNMEIVSIEKKTFEMMVAAFGALSEKVAALRRKSDTRRMERWLTGEEVCRQLRISSRTLQTLRDRRLIGYSQINRRFYYKPEEVKRLIPLVGTLYPHGR